MRQVAPWLSQEELALFNELFSTRFGLFFPEHKREILESRLLPRLRANHLQRFIDYYLLLQYDFRSEVDALTQAITNNESYFFREISQFEALQGEVLRGLISGGSTPQQLRILSAGCSSGEEPYTLSIYLQSQALGLGAFQIEAMDLDGERLEQARNARYRSGSLRALSREQTDRYFSFDKNDETYQLRQPFRQSVNFQHGNILDFNTYPRPRLFDALFCRNVLIYFSESALKSTIELFARAVRPGGLLFLGHSESIIGLTPLFQAERLGGCIAYRRKDL